MFAKILTAAFIKQDDNNEKKDPWSIHEEMPLGGNIKLSNLVLDFYFLI